MILWGGFKVRSSVMEWIVFFLCAVGRTQKITLTEHCVSGRVGLPTEAVIKCIASSIFLSLRSPAWMQAQLAAMLWGLHVGKRPCLQALTSRVHQQPWLWLSQSSLPNNYSPLTSNPEPERPSQASPKFQIHRNQKHDNGAWQQKNPGSTWELHIELQALCFSQSQL